MSPTIFRISHTKYTHTHSLTKVDSYVERIGHSVPFLYTRGFWLRRSFWNFIMHSNLVVWEMPLKEIFNSEVEVPNVVRPIAAQGSWALRRHLNAGNLRAQFSLSSQFILIKVSQELCKVIKSQPAIRAFSFWIVWSEFDNRLWEKSHFSFLSRAFRLLVFVLDWVMQEGIKRLLHGPFTFSRTVPFFCV